MANSALSCSKYMTFLFNLIFFIFGICLVIGAIFIKALKDPNIVFLDEVVPEFAWSMIAIGCIITIISFFGCCGSIIENSCLLLTFSITMFIVLLAEIGLGLTGYILVDKLVEGGLEKGLEEGYKHSSLLRAGWNIFQYQSKCCGVNGPADWIPVLGGRNVPASCCANWIQSHIETCDINNAMQIGCKDKFLEYNVWVIIVCAAIVLFQIFSFTIGCWMYVAYRNKREEFPRFLQTTRRTSNE